MSGVVCSVVELLRRRDVRLLLAASFVVGVWMGFVSGLPDYIVEAESFGVIEHPAMESSRIDPTPVDMERVLFIRRYSHLLDGEVLGVIVDESRKYGIDPLLIMAQIEVESSFNPHAVSRVGAYGLMQIMPDTGKQLARELGYSSYDLFDPVTNVRMGIYYMSKLIKRFGDYNTALSAYFWGQTRVAKDAGSYRSTEYSRKVNRAVISYRL